MRLQWVIASFTIGCVAATRTNLIVDTDLFANVDDVGALQLAATLPNVNLLGVNINYPSSYSAVTASAILFHYGRPDVPIGIKRPLNDNVFHDTWKYEFGEYTSKIAYHFSGGSIPWGHAEDAWAAVTLYRKLLSEAEDASVTIASIGFFDNLSALMNSTADGYSEHTGVELLRRKVSKLVIMGGGYPSGYEFNFWGSNPQFTAHVIHNYPGRMVFVGIDVGDDVKTGGPLMACGPKTDPIRMAYVYYGYYTLRPSWDPLTILYAANGLGDLFTVEDDHGYNHIEANGSNRWIHDTNPRNQSYLRLKVANEIAAAELDRLLLETALKFNETKDRYIPDLSHQEL